MSEHVEKISGLSKEQKIGFVLLLIFAFFTVGLGIMQIRNTMYSHFALKNSIPLGINEKINTVDALRFRDTDKDGLTDYEEIYVYGTSAYLADSDSDGISDKDEIAKGTDPLCTKGQNCDISLSNQGTTSSTLENLPPEPTGLSPQDFLNMIQDPKAVRKMLLDSGVKQDVLDKVNDTELMGLIQKLMTPVTSTPQ